jgi:Domain of unknown function (DUF4340)
MSGNRLLTAIVVLAGLSAVTLWQWNKRDTEDAKPPEVSVTLPKIKKDDVTEITIAAPERPSITAKKVDGEWQLTAPVTSRADKDALDTAVTKLEELEVVAVAATLKDNHEKLEVVPAKAVHVVAKKDDKVLLDVLIGAYRTGNTMVRESSADTVATVKGSIKYAFNRELKDWRERQVVNSPSEQIESVQWQNKNGSFKFVRDGEAWKQADGEKPIAGFESGKIVSLVGTATTMKAANFAADDVTKDAAGVGDKPVGTVILTTKADAGGKTIKLRIGNKTEGGYYAFHEDKTPIFIITDFAGERMLSGPDKFVKDEPKPGAAAAPTNPHGAATQVLPHDRKVVATGTPVKK